MAVTEIVACAVAKLNKTWSLLHVQCQVLCMYAVHVNVTRFHVPRWIQLSHVVAVFSLMARVHFIAQNKAGRQLAS